MDMSQICRLFLMGVLSAFSLTFAHAETYFEWLVAQPEHHSSTSLRSQAEVIENIGYEDLSKATTVYDPVMDAAKFTVPANEDDINPGDQINHEFPYVDSANLLVYWEALAPAYWAQDGDVDGVRTFKAFQLARDDDLALEFRYLFRQADPNHVARLDTRVYGNKQGVEIGSGSSAQPQTGEFHILPDKWNQFWAFVDFDNNQFSYWAGDEDREPVRLLDAIPFDWQVNYGSQYGFDGFWFEFNSSQDRQGPEAYMYGRNLVVLRNVSDLESIVTRGVTSSGDQIPPTPPVLDSVQ